MLFGGSGGLAAAENGDVFCAGVDEPAGEFEADAARAAGEEVGSVGSKSEGARAARGARGSGEVRGVNFSGADGEKFFIGLRALAAAGTAAHERGESLEVGVVGLGGEVDVRAGEFGMLAGDDAAEPPGGALGGGDSGAIGWLRCVDLLSARGDEPEFWRGGLRGARGGVDGVDDVFGELEGVGRVSVGAGAEEDDVVGV